MVNLIRHTCKKTYAVDLDCVVAGFIITCNLYFLDPINISWSQVDLSPPRLPRLSFFVNVRCFTYLQDKLTKELETKAMPLLRQCNTGRTWLKLPITTTEKKTSLAIHVVQKITITRAQKIGKFAVWNLILRNGAIWRRREKFEHGRTTAYHPL